jgi:hypothetical protein
MRQISKPPGFALQMWQTVTERGIRCMAKLGDETQLQRIFGNEYDKIITALSSEPPQPASAGFATTQSAQENRNKRPLPAIEGDSDESNPRKRAKQLAPNP